MLAMSLQSLMNWNVSVAIIKQLKFNLVSNLSRYGFEQPTMACCGSGGPPLNCNSRISRGQTKVVNGKTIKVKTCSYSAEFISWDGIHYTEAANQYVSSQILTGNYSDPPFYDKMPFLLNVKL